jgi:TldD protein
MESLLTRIDSLGDEIARRARTAGVLSIFRTQDRSVRRVLVREGRPESTSAVSSSGYGIQVVNADGYTAMGGRDDLREEPAVALLEQVVDVAGRGAALGLERVRVPDLPVGRGREIDAASDAWAEIDLAEVTRRLIGLEGALHERVADVTVQVSYRAEIDNWRIFRSDGTDVWFSVPRCTLGLRATSTGDRARHGVSAVVFSASPRLLDDPVTVGLFLRRAEAAACLARDLPDAPSHPAGSFPLVIDYALAKGLAHEAFGHASEADAYRSSILASEGRFRVGQPVGAEHVSIIDEPIRGDHAWQPFSANGLVRERAVLVDHGVLADGLSDPWSAESGGVRLTGAARAESFHHAPQPRMSNIRIEVDDPAPAPGEFEDYGPEQVRDLVAQTGLFRRHPKVVFLSGYSGGQVNTATGDFVFHCKAIYDLTADGVTFFKPAIFSGSMFGALRSVREAFGPLKLDAVGHCGKWGQSVPSSGGSHYFLVLEPHETVRLGGR